MYDIIYIYIYHIMRIYYVSIHIYIYIERERELGYMSAYMYIVEDQRTCGVQGGRVRLPM